MVDASERARARTARRRSRVLREPRAGPARHVEISQRDDFAKSYRANFAPRALASDAIRAINCSVLLHAAELRRTAGTSRSRARVCLRVGRGEIYEFGQRPLENAPRSPCPL